MTADPPVPPDRRNSFDLVRLIAALTVFLAHQLSIAGYVLPEYHQFAGGPSTPKLADVGLYIFFALSGYLVYRSLEADSRARRFALARALRIYPGAAVNAVACVVFGAAVTAWSAEAYWADGATWRYLVHNVLILLPPSAFQLPGVLGESRFPAVNVPIWTLKYELLCYAALFAVVRTAGHQLARVLGFIVLLATAAFVYGRVMSWSPRPGVDTLGDFDTPHVVRFFMVFFASALYAAIGPLRPRTRVVLALALAVVWLLAPVAALRFTAAIYLIGLGALELGQSRWLFSRAYHRIGDLSYGTYLYAYPLQMLTLARWLTPTNFWALTAVDVAVTLGCAALSWRLVERPALRLKPRPRRVAPQAVDVDRPVMA